MNGGFHTRHHNVVPRLLVRWSEGLSCECVRHLMTTGKSRRVAIELNRIRGKGQRRTGLIPEVHPAGCARPMLCVGRRRAVICRNGRQPRPRPTGSTFRCSGRFRKRRGVRAKRTPSPRLTWCQERNGSETVTLGAWSPYSGTRSVRLDGIPRPVNSVRRPGDRRGSVGIQSRAGVTVSVMQFHVTT